MPGEPKKFRAAAEATPKISPNRPSGSLKALRVADYAETDACGSTKQNAVVSVQVV